MNYVSSLDSLPPGTFILASVRHCICNNTDLKRHQREDLLSALNTVARVLKRRLDDIPADPRMVGNLLAEASPAAHGISQRRWANVRSLVRHALALAGPHSPARQSVMLDPDWQALTDKLPAPYRRAQTSAFIRFCMVRNIAPEAVTQETFDAYERAVMASLRRNPAATYRETVRAWNLASETVPGWPSFKAFRASRQRIWAHPWSEFPLLARDKDAWLWNLNEDNPKAKKALRPQTLKALDGILRRAASALVHQGWDKRRFTKVRHFGTLAAFRAVLHGMRQQHRNGKLGPHATVAACILMGIARHQAKASPAVLAKMKEIIDRLRQDVPPGMTENNDRRLAPFKDPAVAARLLKLPAAMDKAARKIKSRYKAALLIQWALAVELLLVTLMRMKNLAALDLEKHFVRGDCNLWIKIPTHEVKNRRNLSFPLPPRTLLLLDLYLRAARPLLTKTPTTALFPGRSGCPKGSNFFGKQISRAVQRWSGLTIHPHLFRHIAAMLYLKTHPGAYEAVRRMLGHSHVSNTIAAYIGLEADAAFEQYHADVLATDQDDEPKR